MSQKGVFETSKYLMTLRQDIFEETCREVSGPFSYAEAMELTDAAYAKYQEKIEEVRSTLSDSVLVLDSFQKGVFKAELIEKIKDICDRSVPRPVEETSLSLVEPVSSKKNSSLKSRVWTHIQNPFKRP